MGVIRVADKIDSKAENRISCLKKIVNKLNSNIKQCFNSVNKGYLKKFVPSYMN
jgi:hypothetical protein